MGPLAEWEDQMVTDTDTPAPATEPVRVTLELPPRLVADYQRLAAAGVYLSLEEALRHGLTSSWRFERASYLSLRLDLRDSKDGEVDEDGSADGAATGDEPDAGGPAGTAGASSDE